MNENIQVKKRYELKYVLNKGQLAFFKSKIQEHMKFDKYGLTSIASMYFDTPNNVLINRSIEKPEFKEKIRLRSYGLASKDSPLYLEIKRKVEGVVYKRRIALNEEEAMNLINKGKTQQNGQINEELKAFIAKYPRLEAQYLVIYDRLAYYQDNSDLRVTIDMNPRYRTNELNLHTSMNGDKLLEEGSAILEIKVQHAIPLWLVKILNEGKIYQSSFSKVGAAYKLEKAHLRNKVTHQEGAYMKKGEYQYGLAI